MSFKLKCLKVASVGALLFALVPAASNADTCLVDTPDPDAAITGASNTTACGIGAGEHPTDSSLDGFVTSGTWFEINRVNSDNGGTAGQLSYAGDTFDDGAATSGDWAFDLAGNAYTHLVLILKDGNMIGSTGKWVWFLLDLAGSCPNGTSFTTGPWDLCGEWYMWGNDRNRMAISYMSIWGIQGNGGQVPEPATLLLMGFAFAGLAFVQRRRRAA
jgi:hypothetical protein